MRLFPNDKNLLLYHLLIFVSFIAFWKSLTAFDLMSAFFVGDPFIVFRRIIDWFLSGMIFRHLLVTLTETVVAFVIGSLLGLMAGLWLGLSESASRLASPYLKGFNAMPRVILAPIFSVWFGLGMTSKIALGITLVFFVVFFNVYQGVKEVSPVTLANARMLGASKRQLLRSVYIPSATSWVFSSLHAAVGMAFVGAVIGEYMGSAAGVGYLILQAEGLFDINGVFAGVILLTFFAIALDAIVTVAEKRLLHWQPRDAATVGGAVT
ncbi:ABC transporter permease [Aureimonas fodinaquatilis]|uniref:ABC transporter permease n=1 Tax=Aureimonas fodinaquatilis TaxID=2565783 RepID=A0A5B0DP77_9HYPH|nr:ABC transporter permease [Aureimonas fodinaquatilis]KAA0968213.1 ABC transporter permease [Aureimonas fodinaquatilis]